MARLASLEQLALSRLPGITDAGLIPLQNLKNLRQLQVIDTKVTAAGVAALRQAVPSLTQVLTQSPRRPAPAPAPVSVPKGAARSGGGTP